MNGYLAEIVESSPDSTLELSLIPPETFIPQSAEPTPQATDQYLLGLLAFHILTNTIPKLVSWVGTQTDDVSKCTKLKNIHELPGIQDYRGGFHSIFVVIDRMLALDPRDRFADLGSALSAIKHPELHSLEIVRASYRRCIGDEIKCDKFFTDFYSNFLNKSKQAENLFKNHGFITDDKDQNKKRQKWKKQKAFLAHGILLLLTFFEHKYRDELEEPSLLTLHRHRHKQPNLYPNASAYRAFLSALLDTVEKHDESWIKSNVIGRHSRDIWKTVLQPGIDYMKD